MKDNINEFDGDSIQLARAALGLRQRDLAVCLGVPPQRISDWETGLRIPTPEQARRLMRALSDRLPRVDGSQER